MGHEGYIQVQGSSGIGKIGMTNMIDARTCSMGCLNMILVVVIFFDSEFVEVVCEVVGCTGISIPVCVDVVRQSCCRQAFFMTRVIKSMVSFYQRMSWLAADLAERTPFLVSTIRTLPPWVEDSFSPTMAAAVSVVAFVVEVVVVSTVHRRAKFKTSHVMLLLPHLKVSRCT